MLDQLPSEIIAEIAHRLPTASAIISLSLTNRKLHRQVCSEENAIFRLFVRQKFPTISVPSVHWKETACLLTTRSRAWERRAFVAKALNPRPYTPAGAWETGSWRRPDVCPDRTPILDVYETWSAGGTWIDRREVLAWGSSDSLWVRVRQRGRTRWRMLAPHHHDPAREILHLWLLRPEQKCSWVGEEVVLQRQNGNISKCKMDDRSSRIQESTIFDTRGLTNVHCMAVSRDRKPLLAVCGLTSMNVFDGSTEAGIAEPVATSVFQSGPACKYRRRCATYLEDHQLAVGIQYLHGSCPAPIEIYRVRPDCISTIPEHSFAPDQEQPHDRSQTRSNANIIVPLDDVGSSIGRPGELVLSGWSDGIIRLHDTRGPESASIRYYDSVDDGQICSLLPTGYERFLAGSYQNACLKIFDFRMPGAKVYSYLDAGNASPLGPTCATRTPPSYKQQQSVGARRPVGEAVSNRLNIFLAGCFATSPTPPPRRRLNRLRYYRGPVYSLAAPSPASPTVYAGVEDHVIQLDFVSTDDVKIGRLNPSALGFDCGEENDGQILDLSCYERPRPGYERTDPVLLRKQIGWKEPPGLADGLTEEGWDERWRLPKPIPRRAPSYE